MVQGTRPGTVPLPPFTVIVAAPKDTEQLPRELQVSASLKVVTVSCCPPEVTLNPAIGSEV